MINVNLDNIETQAIDLVAKVSPWLAPLPTAFLVGRATVEHLNWPIAIGAVAAAVIESLGLASTATALELYEYNVSKRKTDNGAPVKLAVSLVGIYFGVATGLTIALDVFPSLATYAPAIFPLLSLTGVSILALRSDHKRRLEAIHAEKAEKRAERLHNKTAQDALHKTPKDVHSDVHSDVQNPAQYDALGAVNAQRTARHEALLNALLEAYRDNPDLKQSEAARLLDVHRNSIANFDRELIQSGRLVKNGHGAEVCA